MEKRLRRLINHCNQDVYKRQGHEEKGKDSLYLLKDYVIEENDCIYNSKNVKQESIIAINLAKANRIELYYSEHIGLKEKMKKHLLSKSSVDVKEQEN